MKDSQKLEFVLGTLIPDVVIHLASISSAVECFNNPLLALQTNGIVTSTICDIIHRRQWNTKLIHASSSEIYKGHIDYTVKEDDTHMLHLHPYSIAKIMAHSIVDFYRNTYDLPFSNAVLFTVESPLKKDEFLLNKVANHAHDWKKNSKPLTLGNLESYRNIIHSLDVAHAIRLISLQDKGSNYLVCNENSVKISSVVIDIYRQSGIDVFVDNGSNIVETGTNKVIATTSVNRPGDMVTNIQGYPTKLKDLGWKPSLTIESIIGNIVSKD